MPKHVQLIIDGMEYAVEAKTPQPKDCWQTPGHILELVRETFATKYIYTDPCTTLENPTNAKIFYTHRTNGLRKRWEENAFINPPYSDPSLWLKETNAQVIAGNIKEAIALVSTGCLGTNRAGPYARSANAMCLWINRIHFIDPATKKPVTHTSFTSAFLYWGPRHLVFADKFKSHGIVSVLL